MKEKILVINDDDGIRAITTLLLKEQGYEAFEADRGRKGIEESLRVNPDLILLDIMMPEMDGFETCSQLKLNASTKNIPVIFLSSLTSPKDKIKGLEIGGVDFVNNVIDKGELLARVQNQLKIKALTQAVRVSNEQLLLRQEALDKDLSAAAIIQRSFLPSPKLQLPNLEVASLWIPRDKLGGDIFNIIPYDDSKIVLYMLDVSGHDVPSALVTISVSQFLHQQRLLSPQQIMNELDKEYPQERFDRYFTMFYIVLDVANGSMIYSRAGHVPGIKLTPNEKFKLLSDGGPLVGLNLGLPFEEGKEILKNGDKIILYTDGVTDVRNRKGEFFGTEKFYDLLEANKLKPIGEIIEKVQGALKEFGEEVPPQDDISIMGFEYKVK